jgi:hypothetical protein
MNQDLIDIENNFKIIINKLLHNYKDLSNKKENLEVEYNKLEEKEKELNQKESDIEDFKKVSIMSSMSKQIKERDRKITLLEKQVNKYKQQVIELNKKNKSITKGENTIEKDWESLSVEIYNLENTVYDSYNKKESIIPVDLEAKGYKMLEDKRNHNNRFWIKKSISNNVLDNNKLSEDISGSDEEDEILYEEELEGNTYFISESIPKMIYEKLKNDEVGENIGSINNQGTIIWNKKN